jgi:class 3 adenylate cyclase/tetratricopeptide (TPR) repeat protein
MERAAAGVLSSILSYVPQHIAHELISSPTAPRVGGKAVEGTLVLADVTGFTPMSESLAQTGKEGAEELTLVMSACFRRIIDVITDYGGIPLKFAGDSVLALFVGRRHAHRAVRCALVVQQAMRSFRRIATSVGYFPLRVSIGVNTGRFLEVIAGLPSERLHYLIVGSAVNETARLEGVASAGEVLVGPATLAALGPAVGVTAAKGRAYQVVRLNARVRREPSPLTVPGPSTDEATLVEALQPFIPPQVVEKTKARVALLALEGEHRLATVMFVNFRGARGQVSFDGQERIAATVRLLDSYLAVVGKIVSRFGGEVLANDVTPADQRLVVAFGALVAHEDDEERAALAALQIRDEVGRLGIPVDQRIGISSGHVFAGEVGSPARKDFTVMGDEVNLAARLATKAKCGQILLSERTHSKIADRFGFKALSPVAIKGKKARLPVYVLSGHRKREMAPRLRAQAPKRPLLARGKELLALRDVFSLVLSGRGQVVEIRGAPGIGKSRLVEEILRLWARRRGEAHVGQCQSFGESTAFLPWTGLLRSLLGVQPAQPKAVRETRIGEVISRLDPALREVAGTLSDVLGFPVEEATSAKSLDPQVRLQRLMKLVAQVIWNKARERPLLLVLEDIHWADVASSELLDHVAADIQDVPVFLCLTQRSSAGRPLALEGMPHHTRLLLEELSPQESVRLAGLTIGARTLPDELADLVVAKSRGNPFYIEQMMRSLADAGHVQRDDRAGRTVVIGDLPTVEVPDSVEGIIMSRLDTLDETSRTILRLASVVGLRFQQPIVEYVLGASAAAREVRRSLQHVERAGLIRLEHSAPVPEYLFEHGLLQQTIYESVPFANRRELHRRVGQYLEEHYSDSLDAYLELLSFHYVNSTDKSRAFLYATKAAAKCARMFANREAIEHYRWALDSVETLPREATSEQVKVYAGLCDLYVLTGRYDEAIAICRAGLEKRRWRARPRPVEEAPSLARGLALLCHRMGVAHERKGQYRRALQWYGKAVTCLQGQDSALEATIYLAMAGALYREGRYAEAFERCARGIDLARSASRRDELAHGYYLMATIYSDTGQTEKAIDHSRRSLDIYRQTGDLPGQAKALNGLGADYYWLGDWEASARCYQESLELCERVGDVTEGATVANNLGEILSDQGDLGAASQLFSKSLHSWETMGYRIGIAVACSNLGRLATRQGRCSEAIELLQKSATIFTEIGSRGLLAEAHARLAEAYLESGKLDSAFTHARKSLGLALRAKALLTEAVGRRVLGQLLVLQGKWKNAERCLLEARALSEWAGARYELGQSLYHLAALYQQAPPALVPDSKVKEAEALATAQGIFHQLGAKRDLARAMALATSMGLDSTVPSP